MNRFITSCLIQAEKRKTFITTSFFVLYLFSDPLSAFSQPVTFSEILGRPTNSSVILSVLFDQQVQVYFQVGSSAGTYFFTSSILTSVPGEPVVTEFKNLDQDKRYYYRTCYKKAADPSFITGTEHTFHTQRATGSSFSFVLEADPHPYDKKGIHSLWKVALQNQLADTADFMIDMGDTFGDDHNPTTITDSEIKQLHLNCREFFGISGHSVPLMLCIGNHEGESGYYLLQSPPQNLAVYATKWRNFYYPNPIPDGFYSGNTTSEPFGLNYPANYYAWEWGDALFIVLDVYRYTTAGASAGLWDWTLGDDQFNWFKKTLESSKAKFKFVLAHHVRGYGRGAVALAGNYEWGGYDNKGSWTFTTQRPGWELPIHQLMKKNGVTIFFQGHDHLYAKEELDGIVYQEVPMPSDSTYEIGMLANADAYTGLTLGGSGHIRVTVDSEKTKVDFVQAWLPADETDTRKNGMVAHSYTVTPTQVSVENDQPVPVKILLEQNYPNPFNPETSIRYQIPSAGMVTLSVYDILGREVATLVSGVEQAGSHEVKWNASAVSSGIYFCRLAAGGKIEIRKAVLLK